MRQVTRGKRPTEKITEPQIRTLKEIRQLIDQRGFPPSIRELADKLGIAPSSAHDQVNQLVRKGYLRRESGMARGIVIVREPED